MEKEIEYTTIRIKRSLLFRLIELRGKLQLNNNDEVIEYFLKEGVKKKYG